VLTEQNPIEILKTLPHSVFPVECRFKIERARTGDVEHDEFRKPAYPVSLHESTGRYIPSTTVHFDNPAQRRPENAVGWRPEEFAQQLEELLSSEPAATLTPEDIVLSRFTVVEVPPHLVTTDAETGSPAVKPELYTGENTMSIARFEKHNSLSAASVRNKLSDALPGESRTPARLTDLKEVTAKPARHGDVTTGQSGRARYYTEAEAERSGDLSRTPAHYQSRYLDRSSEETRPLGPVMSNLEKFTPSLLQDADDLVTVVKFIGHEQERRSFVATEVRE
jgi:hypothetical protein